jgi:phosphohistidine phosphatase
VRSIAHIKESSKNYFAIEDALKSAITKSEALSDRNQPPGKNVDLILWRHADAESGAPDKERKLTAKGRKQAKRVAAWLRKRLPKDVIVLVSPASRAIETAEALTDRYRTAPQLNTDARASEILDAAGWPDARTTVVVVGHQPALGRAAALALAGKEADWKIRKGAAWWLACGKDEEEVEVALRAVVPPEFA